MFNQKLSQYLGLRGRTAALFSDLLITEGSAGASRLRFEQIVTVLRETIDPELAILDTFDQDVRPGYLHYALAHMLGSGCAVLTPNFDSLIERAYRTLFGSLSDLNLACVERPGRKYRGYSFLDSWKKKTTKGLYKLHGTLHIEPSVQGGTTPLKSTKDTIGATLDALGHSSRLLQLEHYKKLVFTRNLKSYTLIVLGYSGLDEFDIVPSLAEIVHHISALYWISHKSGALVRLLPSSDIIPASIKAAAEAACVPTYVIQGDTSLAFIKMFPQTRKYKQRTALAIKHVAHTFKQPPEVDKLLVVARAAEMASRQDDAQRLYAQVAVLYRRSKAWIEYGDALRRRARLLHVLGDHRLAERLIQTAVSIHEKHRTRKARHGLAADLIQRAIIVRDQGDLRGALRDCGRARRLSRALAETDGITRSYMEEATIRSLMGQPDRAIPLTEQALLYCNRNRKREDAGMCYTKLAGLYRLTGRLRRAVECARSAQRIHKMVDHTGRLAQAYSGEAHCKLMLGNVREAIQMYGSVIKMFQKIKRYENVVVARSNIATAEIARGNYAVALPVLKDGWRYFTSENLPLRASSSCDDIALCYLEMGQMKLARLWLKRGSVSKPGKSGDSLAARLNTVALVCADVKNAWKTNTDSLRLCKQHHLILEFIRGLYIRSMLASKRGNQMLAFNTLLKAKELVKKYNYGLLAGDIYEALGDCYVSTKNQTASRRMFKRAAASFLTIDNKAKVHRINQKLGLLAA